MGEGGESKQKFSYPLPMTIPEACFAVEANLEFEDTPSFDNLKMTVVCLIEDLGLGQHWRSFKFRLILY